MIIHKRISSVIYFCLLFCVLNCSLYSVSFVEQYDEIWDVIHSTFPIDEEQGSRWADIREVYREKLNQVDSQTKLTSLCNRMFNEMRISHMRVVPSGSMLEAKASAASDNMAYPGFDLTWINDSWYINSILEESELPQKYQGYEILKIDGAQLPSDSKIYTIESLIGVRKWMFGCVGDSHSITIKGPNGEVTTHTVHLIKWPWVISMSFGNFPSIPVRFEEEVIREVKIVRFSNFVMDIHSRILSAIKDAEHHKGLIIDLRGNTGGVGMMANGIAGRMSDHEFSMGTMKLKQGQINFHVYPQPNPYLGKVAVLIDQFSASTSEIFAQGLQEDGRAKIFGVKSMGAALPSKFMKLRSGLLFQQAIATLTSAEGRQIEGNGVIPDKIVNNTKDGLIHNEDKVLCSALDWVLSNPS